MKTHIVIDGNAFYEVDEECMEKTGQKNQEGFEKDTKIKDLKKKDKNDRRTDSKSKK